MAKEKNWLIRTSNFQILGPVSKAKVLDFVNKGSLREDDELSSGNGYWFSIKEKDLLEKYIFGDLLQSFNPISEAPSILTLNESPEHTATHNKIIAPQAIVPKADIEIGDSLPAADDLEYPDMEAPSAEIKLDNLDTVPVARGASKHEQSTPELNDLTDGELPDDIDLEYPDIDDLLATNNSDQTDEIQLDELLGATATSEMLGEVPAPLKNKKKTENGKQTQRNDKLLFVLVGVFFVSLLITATLFYYKKILNKPLPIFGSAALEWILPSVEAQISTKSLVKKKVFLTLKTSLIRN